jgi:cytochrome c peroxidase
VASIADAFPNFTDQENRGKTIFFGQHTTGVGGLCGGCHLLDNPLLPPPGPNGPPQFRTNTAVFYGPRPLDNGLGGDDPGFGETSGNPLDIGTFKSPTLRNIERSAPYMHDGRFATLEEVVEFYDHEIQDTPNLAAPLRQGPGGPPIQLALSDDDKAALVAFLKTLTDDSIASEPRFSDPFQ